MCEACDTPHASYAGVPRAAAAPPAASGRRSMFVSLSKLLRAGARGLADPRLEVALLLFGGKRSWVFPRNDAERRESHAENPAYLRMDGGLRDLIERKEGAGEVCWLKPEGFVYDGGLHSGDPGAYPRVSTWLEALDDPATGAKYKPLILDPDWWLARGKWAENGGGFARDGAKFTRAVATVVTNFQNGAHDYMPMMELLHQSNPTIDVVLDP